MPTVNQRIDQKVASRAPQGDAYLSVRVTRGHARASIHNAIVPLVILLAVLALLGLFVCPAIFAAIPHAPAGVLLLGI